MLSPWSFHFNQLSLSFIILTLSLSMIIFPHIFPYIPITNHDHDHFSWETPWIFHHFPIFGPFHSSQPSPPSAGTPATAAVPRLAAAPTSPPARFTGQGRHGWPGAGGRSVGAAAKRESWGWNWNYGKSMKIYDTIWLFNIAMENPL